MTRSGRQKAFSLVELLIVIAIIAMLTGILVPSLGRAKSMAKRMSCLSNMRNMVIAANEYATVNDGSFPVAYYRPPADTSKYVYVSWDFRYRTDGKIDPGLLWSIGQNLKVQQCPSYEGPANWPGGDRYTGYNYNTSYIGHGEYEAIFAPAKIRQVKDPSRCAIFGDGEYSGGANKFMRSPFGCPGDSTFSSRSAGTQGFRHLHTTNAGFCDGHAEPLEEKHTETSDPAPSFAESTGFLSSDNDLYDLE